MSGTKSSSITTRVIGGVLTAGILWAISKIPGALSWVADRCVSFWHHITNSSIVPNGLLYLLGGCAVYSLLATGRYFWQLRGPTVNQYNEDKFLGLVWRWSFTFKGSPTNTWAFCPNCDTQLVYTPKYEYGNIKTILSCETCNTNLLTHEGDKDYLVEKINRQIDRKIRNGDWMSLVKQ